MGFFFFGSVSFVFAILLASVGVICNDRRSKAGRYLIYISAVLSLPGFFVIWDFAIYRIVWLFPWN